jgi:putative ABC transport system substrate-binding protein
MEGQRTRRAFLARAMTAVAGVAAASCAPPILRSSTGRLARIGYVEGVGQTDGVRELTETFRTALRDLGYIEGTDLQVELRHCVCRSRSPSITEQGAMLRAEWDRLATELVAIPVDVIVVRQLAALESAMAATKRIPIVSTFFRDPAAYGDGNVGSLARPGGTVTGLLSSAETQSAKRLELLKEVAPAIGRVAVINDGNRPGAISVKGAEEAGHKLGITVDRIYLGSEPSEVAAAFESSLDRMRARGVDALLVGEATGGVMELRREIAMYAIEHRLPLAAPAAVSAADDWARAGALITFGPDERAVVRRLAFYVDRILRGASAGDLPIEQVTTFDLTLNPRTATALGLTFPQTTVARATRVLD